MVHLISLFSDAKEPITYFLDKKKYRHMIGVKDTQLTVLNDVKEKMNKVIKKYI
jgi:hypothetical protein